MITFDDFKPDGSTPLYMQILHHIKRGAVAGSVANGDELPSRRVLSALLGINPNTVQKAYRMLEDEGLIVSHAGAKSFMSLDDSKIAAIRAELYGIEVCAMVSSLKQMGMTKDDALALVGRIWDEGEKE